jgi:hypothetical protein
MSKSTWAWGPVWIETSLPTACTSFSQAYFTEQLVKVLPQWSLDGHGSIQLVRPSTKLIAGKTKAFVDWLVAELSPPPWMK